MKFLILLFFFLCFGSLSVWADGQEIGSAGGFARCRDGKYYSYDFLLKIPNHFGGSKAGLTLSQRIQFISFHLKRLKEPLVSDFDLFFSLVFTQKTGARFNWFPAQNLPLMYQPDLESYLPVECRTRRQAVIFFEQVNMTQLRGDYRYDAPLLKQVDVQPEGSLQISYLLVHEWLWTYFEQEQFINSAIINRLFQSEKLGTMTELEYQQVRALYLKIRPPKKSIPR